MHTSIIYIKSIQNINIQSQTIIHDTIRIKRYNGIFNVWRYLDYFNQYYWTTFHLPLDAKDNIFFQQNSASTHYAIIVRQYLNQMYPNGWMGNHIMAVPYLKLDNINIYVLQFLQMKNYIKILNPLWIIILL